MEKNVRIEAQGSVIVGAIWMIVISLLLFWLPFGPLIAGVVGGKWTGGVGSAIAAAFLPALFLGVFFLVAATALTGLPIVGLLAGAGGFFLAAAGVGLLLRTVVARIWGSLLFFAHIGHEIFEYGVRHPDQWIALGTAGRLQVFTRLLFFLVVVILLNRSPAKDALRA